MMKFIDYFYRSFYRSFCALDAFLDLLCPISCIDCPIVLDWIDIQMTSSSIDSKIYQAQLHNDIYNFNHSTYGPFSRITTHLNTYSMQCSFYGILQLSFNSSISISWNAQKNRIKSNWIKLLNEVIMWSKSGYDMNQDMTPYILTLVQHQFLYNSTIYMCWHSSLSIPFSSPTPFLGHLLHFLGHHLDFLIKTLH